MYTIILGGLLKGVQTIFSEGILEELSELVLVETSEETIGGITERLLGETSSVIPEVTPGDIFLGLLEKCLNVCPEDHQ